MYFWLVRKVSCNIKKLISIVSYSVIVLSYFQYIRIMFSWNNPLFWQIRDVFLTSQKSIMKASSMAPMEDSGSVRGVDFFDSWRVQLASASSTVARRLISSSRDLASKGAAFDLFFLTMSKIRGCSNPRLFNPKASSKFSSQKNYEDLSEAPTPAFKLPVMSPWVLGAKVEVVRC